MQTSWQGLDETEALGRLQALGPNALASVRSRGLWRIVISTLREPMFLLLVVASVLYLVEADGRIEVRQGRACQEPQLWLHGYGDWTGAASATLIGSGRTAREHVGAMIAALNIV